MAYVCACVSVCARDRWSLRSPFSSSLCVCVFVCTGGLSAKVDCAQYGVHPTVKCSHHIILLCITHRYVHYVCVCVKLCIERTCRCRWKPRAHHYFEAVNAMSASKRHRVPHCLRPARTLFLFSQHCRQQHTVPCACVCAFPLRLICF